MVVVQITPIDVVYGTAADLAGINPVLRVDELGVETDTGRWKAGDGVTAWASLGYVGAGDAVVEVLVRGAGTNEAGNWLPIATLQTELGGGDLDSLSDVVLTNPANGEVLKFDGTNWVNGTDIGGGGGGTVVVQSDDVTVDAAAATLDFGNGLDVTSSPAGEANVVVDLGEYSGAALPVAGGGTGATTAGAARTALGLVIGTDVAAQGHNHDAAYQPLDADLTAIAALVSAADKVPYATGAGTWALGDLSAYARTLLDDVDAATARGTLGLGALATLGSVGTTEIANDAVTNAKLANVNSATLKGRVTAAAGDPEDLTGTQATTLLDVFTSALKGLAPASGGGTTNFLRADGSWAAPPGGGGGALDDLSDVTITTPATGAVLQYDGAGWIDATLDSGDVTDFTEAAQDAVGAMAGNGLEYVDATPLLGIANDGVTTARIANSQVTLAKIANIATSRILGRVTAGSGVVEELTGAGVRSLLPTFDDVDKGFAPGSGGGTTNYLRADGTWAAPPGSSHALDDLTDVVLSAPSTGQVLKYNGTNWINDTDATAGGSTALNDLSDVVIAAAAAGDILYHDGTQWIDQRGEDVFYRRPVFDLPGSAGEYIQTPDAAALSLTGDICIVALIAPDDWSPAAEMSILDKRVFNDQLSFGLALTTTGALRFYYSQDGTTNNAHTSSANLSALAGGDWKWVAVSFDADNGATQRSSRFWTSDNGTTWTELGTAQTNGPNVTLFDSTAPLTIGARSDDATQFAGQISRVELRSGIGASNTVGGTRVAAWDAREHPMGPRSVDVYGNVWTAAGTNWWIVAGADFLAGSTSEPWQPWDADLKAIAALTSAANKVPYATGAQTWALADLSAFARTILDDADAAAVRTTIDAAQSTHTHTLDGLSDVVITAAALGDLLRFDGTNWVDYPDSNFAAAGHNHDASYQPLDADLTTLATAFATASAAGPASLALHEDTDNGTNKVTLTAPAAIASDKVITFQDVTGTVLVTGGTDVAVADGGTGASDAATARTNLGLVIGTDVQAQNAILADLAGLTQAADRLPYMDSATTMALATFTAAGRALLDDADAAAQRTTLGLGTMATAAAADYLAKVAAGASVENIGAVESNVNTIAATGATETLDTSVYGVHDCTMDQACTFTFSNPAPSGKMTSFVLILRGAFTPTFPAAVDWGDATAPTYTTPSMYVFSTVDAGTTWLGAQVAKAFG